MSDWRTYSCGIHAGEWKGTAPPPCPVCSRPSPSDLLIEVGRERDELRRELIEERNALGLHREALAAILRDPEGVARSVGPFEYAWAPGHHLTVNEDVIAAVLRLVARESDIARAVALAGDRWGVAALGVRSDTEGTE